MEIISRSCGRHGDRGLYGTLGRPRRDPARFWQRSWIKVFSRKRPCSESWRRGEVSQATKRRGNPGRCKYMTKGDRGLEQPEQVGVSAVWWDQRDGGEAGRRGGRRSGQWWPLVRFTVFSANYWLPWFSHRITAQSYAMVMTWPACRALSQIWLLVFGKPFVSLLSVFYIISWNCTNPLDSLPNSYK